MDNTCLRSRERLVSSMVPFVIRRRNKMFSKTKSRKIPSFLGVNFLRSTQRMVLTVAVILGMGMFVGSQVLNAEEKEPIKVGELHSLSGTMAISEVSLHDVVLMAIDEINAEGGLLG